MYFLHGLRISLLAFAALGATLGALAATPATIGIRLSFEPATLDWNLGDVPIHVINNTVEGLYAISADGQVVPNEAVALPEALDPNAKGQARFVIRLRGGLKWSDGRAVTAADYVYSWKRLRDPATASTYAYLLSDIESARAVNERELEITMRRSRKDEFPHLSVLTHWATFPMREDLVAKYGADWAAKPERMAFNGPYRIASYQHDAKLELVPNPQHREPGKLARIDALIVPDDATALRLYEAGRLHFMGDLGALDHRALAARPDYHAMPSPVLVYLGVDTSHPQLAHAAARQALSQGIDRTQIPKILGSAHTPVASIVPQAMVQAAAGPSAANAAKSAAAALKWTGKPLVLGYFEKGLNRTLCEFVQAQWKAKLGVPVELQGSEVKSYWKKLAQKPYPVFLNSYGPPVWDLSFYFNLLRSDNPSNMGRWKSRAYDAALDAQDWPKAAALLAAETPILPLYFRTYEYLMKSELKGVVLNPMTSLFLDEARLER